MSDVTLVVCAAGARIEEVKTLGSGVTVVKPRYALRGEEITVDAEQAERLLSFGVVRDPSKPVTEPSAEDLVTEGSTPVEIAVASQGVADLGGADDDNPTNPAEATETTSVAALSKQIEDGNLNAKETIALAGGDPGVAQLVLEAETGGANRSTVVTELTKIIEG